MSARDRSEPAFPGKLPLPDASGAEAGAFAFFAGMTLRDYFAGQALVGTLTCLAGNVAGRSDPSIHTATLANYAYSIADAMLAERGVPT